MNTAQIILHKQVLQLSGNWTVKGIAKVARNPLAKIIWPTYSLTVDASQIEQLDSAGAWLIEKIINQLKAKNIPIKLQGLNSQQQLLLSLIENQQQRLQVPTQAIEELNLLASLGKMIVDKFTEFMAWMYFIGEFTILTLGIITHPKRIRWKYLASVIELMGFRALPIIGFLCFLIGVVLTYQIGLELKLYGANIYIVSLLGITILREFGPLITAIILSGRTASSFTAQIGLMKVNEEIDALKTMGGSPTEILTFPRILGLVLLMPLLTVWADIFGMLGGMLMTNSLLDISFTSFMQQIPDNITLTTFIIGICKAPFFALIIASVGCYQGFRVSGGSDSIGLQTTKSVVLSIFLIIIADAIFSVILSWWNI